MAIEVVDRRKKYRVVLRIHGKKVSRSFLRRLDADAWQRRALVQREDRIPVQNRYPHITLNALREKFEQDYASYRQASSTQLTEAGLYRKHVAPYLGTASLKSLTKTTMEEFLRALQKRDGVSSSRVNRIRTLLHGMLNQACRWGLISTNPVSGITPLPAAKAGREQVIQYLTQEEAERLLSWLRANDPWLYTQVRVLLCTGLRYGELIGLGPEDVIPTARGANLMVAKSYCHHAMELRHRTKGGASRVIPLGQSLAQLLFNLSRRRPIGQPLFRESWEECRHPTKFRKHLERAFVSAKVRRIRIHDLRHTYAVHFLENGGHRYDLQKLLGHSDPKLTERYAHFSSAMAERSRGLVDHHATEERPALTVVVGEERSAMSHKCPTKPDQTNTSMVG